MSKMRSLLKAQIKTLAASGFDPPTSGLWAQHASTAPRCFVEDPEYNEWSVNSYIDKMPHIINKREKHIARYGYELKNGTALTLCQKCDLF